MAQAFLSVFAFIGGPLSIDLSVTLFQCFDPLSVMLYHCSGPLSVAFYQYSKLAITYVHGDVREVPAVEVQISS